MDLIVIWKVDFSDIIPWNYGVLNIYALLISTLFIR